jgi:acyl carrier protein
MVNMSADSYLMSVIEAIREVSASAREREIAPETRLLDDLGLDSLDLVGVILRVQEKFAIEIDLDEVPKLERVVDLADSLRRYVSRAA